MDIFHALSSPSYKSSAESSAIGGLPRNFDAIGSRCCIVPQSKLPGHCGRCRIESRPSTIAEACGSTERSGPDSRIIYRANAFPPSRPYSERLTVERKPDDILHQYFPAPTLHYHRHAAIRARIDTLFRYGKRVWRHSAAQLSEWLRLTNPTLLATLKKRRTMIKSACTRIRNYVDFVRTITPAIISQIEEHKSKLERHWNEYNNLQTRIEILEETESSDRIAFEEAYYNLSAIMRDLLRSPSVSTNRATPPLSQNASETSGSLFNVRLPKFDLPKFSGKYDEWFPFDDSFSAIIHTNATLSNIHKLQYLRAAVTGNASAVIGSLEILDANYAIA